MDCNSPLSEIILGKCLNAQKFKQIENHKIILTQIRTLTTIISLQ